MHPSQHLREHRRERVLLDVLESLVPPRKELLLSVDVTWAPKLQSIALTHEEAGRLFPELTPLSAS